MQTGKDIVTLVHRVINRLTERLDTSKEQLDKFKGEFEKRPVYALRWSDSAFLHAAQFSVLTGAVAFLSKEMQADKVSNPVDDLADIARERVHNLALFPPRSTSVQANLVEQHEAQAWASIIDVIQAEKERA